MVCEQAEVLRALGRRRPGQYYHHVCHFLSSDCIVNDMQVERYRDAVATNRRKHGFETIEAERSGFERVWRAREEDPTVGTVSLFATVVDASTYDADDIVDIADRFRAVIDRRTDGRDDSVTLIGYVVFVVPDPDPELVSAATSYVVANRRSAVFPLVYDTETETLHAHPIPRLKGRGIYKRQVEDAERLFEL